MMFYNYPKKKKKNALHVLKIRFINFLSLKEPPSIVKGTRAWFCLYFVITTIQEIYCLRPLSRRRFVSICYPTQTITRARHFAFLFNCLGHNVFRLSGKYLKNRLFQIYEKQKTRYNTTVKLKTKLNAVWCIILDEGHHQKIIPRPPKCRASDHVKCFRNLKALLYKAHWCNAVYFTLPTEKRLPRKSKYFNLIFLNNK